MPLVEARRAKPEAARSRSECQPKDSGLFGQWGLLFLPIALAVGVRCTTLSFQSLWHDEVYTVVEAGRPWSSLLLALFEPRQAYPLYILGIRLWSSFAGTSEAALRWPSTIAGVCTVPLLYLLGRRLFGWRVGLVAAVLLALSPLAVWYSQEAKAYAFLLLLTVAAWLLLWEAIERPTRHAWWAFGVVTGLALLTLRLAIFAVIGQLLYTLYRAHQGRFTRRYRRLLVGLLLVVLLGTSAGLWFALEQTEAARQFGTERNWTDLANTFTQFSLRISPSPPEPGQGPDHRPWLLAFGVAALAGMVSLLLDIRARGRHRRRSVFLLCFLVVPPGVFTLLYLIHPFYHERYLLPALPAYLLLLAVGVASLWRWAAHLSREGETLLSLALGLLALGTILLPLAVSWRQVRDWSLSRRPSKEQFREATRYLQEHLHPGDLIVVHPGYIVPAVEHYQDRFPDVPLELYTLRDPLAEDYGFPEFEADMDDLSRGRRRAWLYLAPYHAQAWDPNKWVYEWFNLNPFLHCDEQRFHGVDLYCVTFNEERREGFPTPTLSLDAPFGQAVLLWGADLEPFRRPLQPGDPLPVTLYVNGLQVDLPDLEVVVRLVGEDGQVWAEAARRPLGGFLPTTYWRPKDLFLDYHELLLPEEMPAGRYTAQVGYRPTEGPSDWLLLPDGSPWAILGPVEVVPKGGSP